MSRADELRALLARVEEATEPSRSLEDDIALALGWTKKDKLYVSDEGDPLDIWTEWFRPDGKLANCPDCWTEVLDYALELCGEALPGWRRYIEEVKPNARWWAGLKAPEEASAGVNGALSAFAATPALALCAALLSALIAREEADAERI